VSLILTGPQVYAEQSVLPHTAVVMSEGLIQAITAATQVKNTIADEVHYFPENYHLVAGFIDLHVHGVNGQDVMDATPEALGGISKALAAEGTTGFLAATMTAKTQEIENALVAVRDFMDAKHAVKGAAILGVHLEGPFISPKRVGAQRADQILVPDILMFERWQQVTANVIKLVTLAPELSNSVGFIRYLKEKGIIAALGHTDATYAETVTAIAEGLSYATHVFNAMRGIHQREPGAVMAALLSEQVLTELIVDGVHLHPAIVQFILKLKTKEKMILVTDAMRAKCLGDGVYDLGGQDVAVKDGVATLPDGTLAGSTLKMSVAIQNMLRFTQCSLWDVLKMASENPAKALGIFHKKGSISVGKDADVVVLDEKFNVVMTLCSGEVVYHKKTAPLAI